MFCTNCGSALEPNALTCARCGNTINSRQQQPNDQLLEYENLKPSQIQPTHHQAAPPQYQQPYRQPGPPQYQQPPVPPQYQPYPQPYQQQPYQQPYPQPYQQRQAEWNIFAIIGFVLFWVYIPIGGLVCSIIGLRQCNQTGQKGRGLAIAGVVLHVLAMLVFIGLIVAGVLFAFNTPDILSEFGLEEGYSYMRSFVK